jgi:hypothetical protein
MVYSHTVRNSGTSADFKNLTAISSQGWAIRLYESDGVTPLTDHNGDGIPDTGRLSRNGRARIVVAVTVPASAPAGVKDVTTVTAASALFPSARNTATATDKTAVNRFLTLQMGTTEVAFGRVSADGALDPAVPGVTSVVDDQGAYYVKEGAIRVDVSGNTPWTGTCSARENRGTARTVRIADGRLEWRLAGTTEWHAFSRRDDTTCFPGQPTGTTTLVYDLRLRVERTDAAGTFNTVATFTVMP